MHKIFVALLFTLSCFINAFAATPSSTDSHFILAVDSNHNGSLNAESIKKGEDYFLVRQNPTVLKPNHQTFISSQGTIYVSAVPEDLTQTQAFKFLQLARMTRDSSIKVMSLANDGYKQIQWVELPNGDKTAYLVSAKGRYDRVYLLPFRAPMMKTISNKPETTQNN